MEVEALGSIWICTKCGESAAVEPTRLLDGSYGTARCPSATCKRERRIFHQEIRRDAGTNPPPQPPR